ncbi:mercuric reductase [Alkalinema sp. FACHB-956]|uniref:mercuric reductase n=1 Tax=Alkalinema sp. FACHB-956 TaxID=2692768 RepID=UPI001683FEEB|nr:mercuric reductase [Alkalinema sp. FACHB-956]MBD2329300.1 mercuric reductase [Alkalinema sp. FACHB-956]
MNPLDRYNQHLIQQVHPPDWVNPTPKTEYDLVVIGAGTAGLVISAGSAGLGIGLKIALIEREYMGGDCLNVGCVPSKCLIRSARAAYEAQASSQLGVTAEATQIDFGRVMERMRQVRSGISHHDSAQRFQDLGVDVFFGEAKFVDRHSIAVNDQSLTFKKAAIASGARAVRPDIPGLDAAGYLTNETVFSLTECPKRLAVIGGGPIGCELAQAFHRLGSEVTLIHKNDHLLDKEDPDAAAIVQNQFQVENLAFHLNAELQSVETTADGKTLTIKTPQGNQTLIVDEILIGTGRQPNVDSLNLDAIGIDYHPRKGITVNDYLQTSQPHIYAAGDCCMDWKFTHAADFAARIVIKNAFFSPFGLSKSKLSDLTMPWVTYTSPEIAHVGLYEQETQQPTTTIMIPMDSVDRALTDGETEGFVKILLRQGSDEILGATIVSSHAGEMISEITTAMVGKIGLGKLASVIHPYPTQADAIRKAADAYRRTLLTDRARSLLKVLTKFS